MGQFTVSEVYFCRTATSLRTKEQRNDYYFLKVNNKTLGQGVKFVPS